MKHENEPEAFTGAGDMPVCNFCDQTYDPYDTHTCKGNQILGRKYAKPRKTIEDEIPADHFYEPYNVATAREVLERMAVDHAKGIADGIDNGILDDLCKQSALETQPGEGKALTYDNGKAPLANLPWAAVEGMSRVQAYGHGKYKDFNNYRKGMEVTRNLSCALRHIKEYLEGHDVDAESGCHPLEHALCRVSFVLQNIAEGKAIDDRYKP